MPTHALHRLLFIALMPLLAVQCVSSKKPQKDTKVSLEKFIVAAAPADMKKIEVNFDDKVTLLGYKLKSKGTVKPGDTVGYTLYWRLDKPMGAPGWKLFTHVFDDNKKRILNVDDVGGLRKQSGKEQTGGPSAWQVGKIYTDEQSFKVPAKTEGRKLSITTGVWKGNDRLKLKSGSSSGENRATVFSISVGGGAKKNEKVPDLRIDKLEKGKSPKIDGKLDEEIWKNAPSAGPFVNVSSGTADEKLPVQGDAKLLWDNTALYLGFNVKDKDVVGGFKKEDQDPHLWTKDCVEIMIDPDGDGDNKDYYEIQINPQNFVFDSQFDGYNLPKGGPDGPFGHQEWSAKLTSAVQIDGTLDKSDDEDKGYTVEVKLPWASFDKAKKTPPEIGSEWRVNLYAMQNNGGAGWSPILGQGNFHKASRFGKLLFAEAGWQPPAPAVASAAASATPSAGTVDALKAGVELKANEAAKGTQPASGIAPATPPKTPSAPKPPVAPKAPEAPKPPTP